MISLPIFQGALSSAADVPSLDLNFSGPSGFFAAKGATPTLTRGSVATYTDSAGVLRTTNSNILLQSNGFNTSSWTPVNATITPAATISPDGQLNAFELKDTVSTGIHEYFQFNISFISGLTYTFSFYAKQSGKRYCTVNGGINAFGGQDFATYDLLNGVVSQKGVSGTAEIVSVGNGWWRCIRTIPCIASVSSTISIVHSPIAAPGYQYSYTGDGTGFYIYGAQIEQASYAGPYSPTTTVATNVGPRIDYDPVTLACKGLLIEEARTNLTPGSNDFSNATYWSTASNVTITPTATISPDSTLNAFELRDTTSNSLHQLVTATNLNVTTGTNYTFSFYAKKSGKRYVSTNRAQAIFGTEDYVIFDLELGIITFKATGGTATITPVGNDWYRCTHTLPAIASGIHGAAGAISLATAGTFTGRAETYIGNGTGIYIYGAQFEVGTFPTSYIPTTTATVTRNADVCGIASLTGIWNATEGTSIVDFVTRPSIAGTYSLAAYKNAGGTNYLKQQRTLAAESSISAATGTIDVQTDFTSLGAGKGEMAIAYKSNDFAGVLNAGSAIADTSGATFTSASIDSLNIGRDQAGANWLNGHIARLRYFNKRLSNARLQNSTYADALDWRNVGPKYYQQYKSSIESTIATATVSNTVETPAATFPSSGAFEGGVLLPDGRVFCVPTASTSAIVFNPANGTVTTPTGSSFPGADAFTGGVLLRDGTVFCVPRSSTTARIFDPVSNSVRTPAVSFPGGTAFLGGVLLPNGKVFCLPGLNNRGRIYDPVTETVTIPAPTFPIVYLGGVLLPNGKVFCSPANSTTSATTIYDPILDTIESTTGDTFTGNGFGGGAVLLPDGRVFCIPRSSTSARIYNPITNVVSTPSAVFPGTTNGFIGGVLLPNGNVFCVPFDSTNAVIYNPISDTITTVSGFPGSNAFIGGVLMQNGKVFCVPKNSSTTRLYGGGTSFNNNVLLSSYLNKF